MSNTTNMFFCFLGGVAVGAISTVGIMKKIGYPKIENHLNVVETGSSGKTDMPKDSPTMLTDAHEDRTSFDKTHKPNTHKVSYDIFREKPDPEELAKKYEQTMAEHEHPEDDTEEEDEAEFENEIGEACMDRIGHLEMEEVDGYGHVLRQANTNRRDAVIYVVHQDYAGEIYPLEDLVYYSEDEVLCDVTDAPVDNVDALVGDALNDFGGYCGDNPDVVYVRNCSLGFEYEIYRVHGYYGAHIYGVSDDKMADVTKQTKRHIKEEE